MVVEAERGVVAVGEDVGAGCQCRQAVVAPLGFPRHAVRHDAWGQVDECVPPSAWVFTWTKAHSWAWSYDVHLHQVRALTVGTPVNSQMSWATAVSDMGASLAKEGGKFRSRRRQAPGAW